MGVTTDRATLPEGVEPLWGEDPPPWSISSVAADADADESLTTLFFSPSCQGSEKGVRMRGERGERELRKADERGVRRVRRMTP